MFDSPHEGTDVIVDFSGDKIHVFADTFGGGLTAGAPITPDQFLSGPGIVSASDADDRFIYNTATGELFFDVDGSGDAGSVHIATLSNRADLGNTDIVVF